MVWPPVKLECVDPVLRLAINAVTTSSACAVVAVDPLASVLLVAKPLASLSIKAPTVAPSPDHSHKLIVVSHTALAPPAVSESVTVRPVCDVELGRTAKTASGADADGLALSQTICSIVQ